MIALDHANNVDSTNSETVGFDLWPVYVAGPSYRKPMPLSDKAERLRIARVRSQAAHAERCAESRREAVPTLAQPEARVFRRKTPTQRRSATATHNWRRAA